MIARVGDRTETNVRRLVERLRGGDARALARAISLVEDRRPGWPELLAQLRETEGLCSALRVGVTGAPGAGKSTLVDRLAQSLVSEGRRVAVLAVDPSSARTGGALLGDRTRMAGAGEVFIRSMASRGALGGVAQAAGAVCEVLEAAGYDAVLIETVGVGQDEIAVTEIADVTVLLLVPGMGDEVQSMKAGVMEEADVYAVNKADRGGAEQVEAELRSTLALGGREGWQPAVVRCSAATGEGVPELLDAVRRCAAWKAEHGVGRVVAGVRRVGLDGLELDHLGVAVGSIAAARGFYEALGMRVTDEETVEHEQVKVAMLPLGSTRVELLEATAEDSVIGRFVAKRGDGLHHIAIKVESVDAMFVRMKQQGVRLVSDAVKVGAGGHRYFFVHPASTGGVLVEIVGREGEGTR